MIKYLIYSAVLFSVTLTSEKIEYKLINPSDAGEQYLTIIDSDVFYHGKVHIISPDSTKNSLVYFLSKAVNKRPDQNGINSMMFYNFQYSNEVLKVSDFDSSKFSDRHEFLPFDIYNSIWGELEGDTISLRATKHIYENRSDEIKFIKHIKY